MKKFLMFISLVPLLVTGIANANNPAEAVEQETQQGQEETSNQSQEKGITDLSSTGQLVVISATIILPKNISSVCEARTQNSHYVIETESMNQQVMMHFPKLQEASSISE